MDELAKIDSIIVHRRKEEHNTARRIAIEGDRTLRMEHHLHDALVLTLTAIKRDLGL